MSKISEQEDEQEDEDDEDVEQELIDDLDANRQSSSPVDCINGSPLMVPDLKVERHSYLLELCEYEEYLGFIDEVFGIMVCIINCNDTVYCDIDI